MTLKRIATLACLLHVAAASGAESASAAAASASSPARVNLSHCDAFRNSVSAVRSPKDLGKVILRFEVSAQGQPVGSEIVERTTTVYFAHVVEENFSKCEFSPARENGVAVPGHTLVKLDFADHVTNPNNAACPTPFSRERPPSLAAMPATRLRVRFSTTGRVASVAVVQTSGVPALDEAAVKAYEQCHFDPGAADQPAFQEEWLTTTNWAP